MRSSARGNPNYGVNFVHFVGLAGARMKPINVYPLAILLVCIVLLVIWLRPS